MCRSDIQTKAYKREARKKKRRVHVCFKDLEKQYSRVNRKTFWQVLRIYDVGVNCWVE